MALHVIRVWCTSRPTRSWSQAIERELRFPTWMIGESRPARVPDSDRSPTVPRGGHLLTLRLAA